MICNKCKRHILTGSYFGCDVCDLIIDDLRIKEKDFLETLIRKRYNKVIFWIYALASLLIVNVIYLVLMLLNVVKTPSWN